MRQWLALSFACASLAHAELKPLSDETLQDVTGQAGVMIEVSGQMTYEAILFNGQVITPDNPAPNGELKEDSVYMNGYTVGLPQTGTIMDLFGLFMPLTYGEVDTDGDGVRDHGAAVFNFKPNVSTSLSPLAIEPEDTTINFNDQVFITKQGIVFLNAPLDNTYEFNGQTYQYQHPEKLF